jgi:flagellar biosynthesis/type III secretory pathway M-ring protein FliF/YscJ
MLDVPKNFFCSASDISDYGYRNKIKDANALKKRLHAETEEFLEDSGIAREVLAKREQESPKRQEEIEEETPGKWNETLGGLVYLTLFVILCVSLFMQLRLAWRDYQSHKEFEQNTAEMARGKAARDEAREARKAREAAEALRVEETRMIQDKLEKLRQMYSKN